MFIESSPEPPASEETLLIRLLVVPISSGDVLTPCAHLSSLSLGYLITVLIPNTDFDADANTDTSGQTGLDHIRGHLVRCLSHSIRLEYRCFECLLKPVKDNGRQRRRARADEADVR